MIPALLMILKEQDPLPLYSIKLMTMMSEGSRLIVENIYKVDRFQQILSLYDLSHPKFNHCVFKLIQQYLESGMCSLGMKDFNHVYFVKKTVQIAHKFSKSNQDWIFTQIIDIVLAYSNKLFILLTENAMNLAKVQSNLRSIQNLTFVNMDQYKISLL